MILSKQKILNFIQLQQKCKDQHNIAALRTYNSEWPVCDCESVYADEDIFVTETNIPMLVTIVTMGALIIRHGHQRTLGNMRDGDQFPSWASCYLLFIFSNWIFILRSRSSGFWMMMRREWCGPLILMFSRGVFNVFCSIAHYKCFSFNREYLFT